MEDSVSSLGSHRLSSIVEEDAERNPLKEALEAIDILAQVEDFNVDKENEDANVMTRSGSVGSRSSTMSVEGGGKREALSRPARPMRKRK